MLANKSSEFIRLQRKAERRFALLGTPGRSYREFVTFGDRHIAFLQVRAYRGNVIALTDARQRAASRA